MPNLVAAAAAAEKKRSTESEANAGAAKRAEASPAAAAPSSVAAAAATSSQFGAQQQQQSGAAATAMQPPVAVLPLAAVQPSQQSEAAAAAAAAAAGQPSVAEPQQQPWWVSAAAPSSATAATLRQNTKLELLKAIFSRPRPVETGAATAAAGQPSVAEPQQQPLPLQSSSSPAAAAASSIGIAPPPPAGAAAAGIANLLAPQPLQQPVPLSAGPAPAAAAAAAVPSSSVQIPRQQSAAAAPSPAAASTALSQSVAQEEQKEQEQARPPQPLPLQPSSSANSEPASSVAVPADAAAAALSSSVHIPRQQPAAAPSPAGASSALPQPVAQVEQKEQEQARPPQPLPLQPSSSASSEPASSVAVPDADAAAVAASEAHMGPNMLQKKNFRTKLTARERQQQQQQTGAAAAAAAVPSSISLSALPDGSDEEDIDNTRTSSREQTKNQKKREKKKEKKKEEQRQRTSGGAAAAAAAAAQQFDPQKPRASRAHLGKLRHDERDGSDSEEEEKKEGENEERKEQSPAAPKPKSSPADVKAIRTHLSAENLAVFDEQIRLHGVCAVGDFFGWRIESTGSIAANVRESKTATKIRWYTPKNQCVWVSIDLLDPADATLLKHIQNLDLPFSIVQVIAVQGESRKKPNFICLEIESNYCKNYSFKKEYSMHKLQAMLFTKDFESLKHLLKSNAFVEDGKAEWGALSADPQTRREPLVAVLALEGVKSEVVEQRLVTVVQNGMDDASGERVVTLASTPNDGHKLPKIPSSARIVALVSHVRDARLQLSDDVLQDWLKAHTGKPLVVVLICCDLLEKERVRIAKVFSKYGHWIAMTYGERVYYFLEEDIVLTCFGGFLGAVGKHALEQEHRARTVRDGFTGTEHGVCTVPGPVLPSEKLKELASIHLAPMMKAGASGLEGGLQKVSLAFPYENGKLIRLVGAPTESVPLAAPAAAALAADVEQGDVDMAIADPAPQVAPAAVAASYAYDAIDLTMEDSVAVSFGGPGPVVRPPPVSYGPVRGGALAAAPQPALGTQFRGLVHLPDGLPESIYARWGDVVGRNVRKYTRFMDIFKGSLNGELDGYYICFYYKGRLGIPDMRAITKNSGAEMKKAGAELVKPLTRDDARALLALLPPEAKATFEKNCTTKVQGFGAYKFKVDIGSTVTVP